MRGSGGKQTPLVLQPAPLGGQGTPLAINHDAANARLKLIGRLEPDLVLELNRRRPDSVNHPSGLGRRVMARAKSPEFRIRRANRAVFGGPAMAIAHRGGKSQKPSSPAHSCSVQITANERRPLA